MIITPDRLADLAREETEKRAERQPLLAAYLIGSVLTGEPIVGGSADVDLVLIHRNSPLRPREIKRLSADVHLDIFHKARSEFENPRELRTAPHLGSDLYHSQRLFDPDHFFDWVQASACAQFTRSDNRLARAHFLLENARSLCRSLKPDKNNWPQQYLQAAWNGANALSCLNQAPVTGRRAVADLRLQLEELNCLNLFAGFLQLFQAQQMDQWNLPSWLTAFGKAYDQAIAREQDPTFQTVRRDYFLRAFQSLAESGQAEAVVIPLIEHWPLMSAANEPAEEETEEKVAWQSLLNATGLQHERFKARQADVEHFLDDVELFIESWGAEHGA